MPADLTREEIERLIAPARTTVVKTDDGRDVPVQVLSQSQFTRLAQHILSEPARLASAHAEGVREGWVNGQHRFREEASEALIEARDRLASGRTHIIDGRRLGLEQAASMVRLLPAPPCPLALSPPPSEPTGMTAGQIVSVLGDPLGGVEIKPAEPLNVPPGTVVAWDGKSDLPSFTTAEPSAPVAPEGKWIAFSGTSCPVPDRTQVFVRRRTGVETKVAYDANSFDWGLNGDLTIIAYRIAKWPDVQAENMNARITALEAENAKLRERNAEADRALEPFAEIGAWLFARDMPDDTPMVDLRGINGMSGALTRGHFKAAHAARALLQGGPDAAA